MDRGLLKNMVFVFFAVFIIVLIINPVLQFIMKGSINLGQSIILGIVLAAVFVFLIRYRVFVKK